MLSNAVTAIDRIKQEISQLRLDNAEAAIAAASGIMSVDEAKTSETRNGKLVELLNEIAAFQRSKVHF
jgi:hypothetical protein